MLGMQIEKTFYEILNISENATIEEIKENYKNLVKLHHPDKQTNLQDSKIANEEFVKIDLAWKTLRDPDTKRMYDAKLTQERQDNYVIYARLDLEELDFDDFGVASYLCRCGSSYEIERDSICEASHNEELIISCAECSLAIIVVNE